MNLKEAFRYQSFLADAMSRAEMYFGVQDHYMETTKNHLCSKMNPADEDFVEVVERDAPYKIEDVAELYLYLIEQKQVLTTEIGKAKANLSDDIDSITEGNKYRYRLATALKRVTSSKESSRKEVGYSYRINEAGDQTPYKYNVETKVSDAFDRDGIKTLYRSISKLADECSVKIDESKINTRVVYYPPFDVNYSFDDIMSEFIARKPAENAGE